MKTKYMMSGGLAFSEQKDMEKLRKKSQQGWHVKNFRFMGYGLEQGQKEEWIYSIDYRLVTPEDADEYFDMFTFSGWEHVCSETGMHLFKARPNTVPIYSDASSKIDKFSRQGMYVNQGTLLLVILSALCCALWIVGPQNLKGFFHIVFLCLLVITIPAIMTWGAIQWHKVRERRDDE